MKWFLLLALLAGTIPSFASDSPLPSDSLVEKQALKKDHLNFFVIAKRKKGKLDLATRFNILRSKMRGCFHPNTFISVIATDMEDASRKIRRNLDENNATLGTLWFDSHGSFKKGYSMFYVGKDECNKNTLGDTSFSSPISRLSPYCTSETRVIIGSCYGGATYVRSSIDYTQTMRMDGDSLMMSLGKLLRTGTVYASESWVMSKPGLFHRRPAVGGNPGRKLFLDICYKPVWENIGVWNQYEVGTENFRKANTISLDKTGNLVIRDKPYIIEKKMEKAIDKKLKKLQPGLFK